MNMKKVLALGALVLAFLGANAVYADVIIPTGFTFLKNLSAGNTVSPDVRYLQNLLNQNAVTRVAESGPGSDSDLTDYFGPKTKDAVMRFQSLYANEILVPAGVTNPTGFFGEMSRKKANELLSLLRQTLSPSSAESDEDEEEEETPPPRASRTQSSTNTSLFAAGSFIRAANVIDLRPKIIVISPVLVTSASETITMNGFNFTATGNSVYGNIGSVDDLPSANNTLTFALEDFSNYANAARAFSGTTTKIYLRIANSNGLSQDIAVVSFKFPGSGGPGSATEEDSDDLGVKGAGEIDKEIHALSPIGGLIKLIGGDEAFDTAYGYSPSGVIFGGGMSGGGGGGFGGGSGGSGSGSGGQSTTDFGGRINNVTYCTCSGGVLLDIQDVRGSTVSLMYQVGQSTLHENYNVFEPGIQVLGGYTQGAAQCEVYSGTTCQAQGSPQGTIDFARGVGTGAVPGQ